MKIAAELGSDVPGSACLSQPCWMEGRGERVTRVRAAAAHRIGAGEDPGIAVPTRDVFAASNARTGVGEKQPPSEGLGSLWDLMAYLSDTDATSLEGAATRLAPQIDERSGSLERPARLSSWPRCRAPAPPVLGCSRRANLRWRRRKTWLHEHPDWWTSATTLAQADIGVARWEIP